jgi:hypothetical protein
LKLKKPFRLILAFIFTAESLSFSALAAPQSSSSPAMSNQDAKQFVADLDLFYWAKLDHELPGLTEEALGDAPELIRVNPSSPLLDSDPFFMRSQTWSTGQAPECGKSGSLCFEKSKNGLRLFLGNRGKVLTLNQALTPILETRDHILLSSDSLEMFQAKMSAGEQPGESLFFISKADLYKFSQINGPVPVFSFPLPGEGWTGPNPRAVDLEITDQVVLLNHAGESLTIDRSDLALMEHVERQNMVLAQIASFLEGNYGANNLPLPKPYSTLGFGIIMSGLTPSLRDVQSSHTLRQKPLVARLLETLLPQAEAKDTDPPVPTRLQKLRESVSSRAKAWITPGLEYGAVIASVPFLYDPSYLVNMVPDNYGALVAKVGQILAMVTVASITLKYTLSNTPSIATFSKRSTQSFRAIPYWSE